MLYRISGAEVAEVPATSVLNEDLYEGDVENWVSARPEVLGEPLLLIGRQVQLDEGKDRIDLLAVDKAASLVVVELKRDLIGGEADLQALRYAALVSQWTFEDVRRQAEGYWKTLGRVAGTFAQEIEGFCDEGSELNASQRVILVGRDIKPRLGTMALWLRKQGVDTTVVSIAVLKDDERLYLQPQVIIPVPSDDRLTARVQIGSSDKPWLVDGQAWHLEQVCSPKGRRVVEATVDIIGRHVPEAAGPNWAQKAYISWRHGSATWIYLDTLANGAYLNVQGIRFSAEEVAERLGFQVFRGDAELADKLAMGSSVYDRHDGYMRLNLKAAEDLIGSAGDELGAILREAWAVFTGQRPRTDADLS